MKQKLKTKFDIRSIALSFVVFLLSALFLQSCNSNAGGSTGGNPLQSSLPLQISADAQ